MSDAQTNLEHDGASIHVLAADELLQRLPFFALDPQQVLDLGARRCGSSVNLQQRFSRAQILALDPSWEALRGASAGGWFRRPRYQRVCAALGSLPLRERSVDLVLGHLLLPRAPQPEEALREIARVLRPGGVLLFSALGAGFEPAGPDLAAWGQRLMHTGFCEPVMDVDRHHIASATYELIIGAAFAADRPPADTGAPVARGEIAISPHSIGRKRQR